jgi:DNA-binding transcriptional LysR family regulator
MVNLNDTLAFVAVVRAGSFAEAGRQLGVPKSTLSRQVTRLEQRLGAPLLHRTTRRLNLTELGEAYFARSRHAIEEIEQAERAVAELSEQPAGRLRVASGYELDAWLARLLPEFHARYPEIALEIEMSQRTVDLVAEGFDVALRGGVLRDSTLIARKLLPSGVILAANPDYLADRGTPRELAELADHPTLAYGPTSFPGGGWKMVGPDGLVDLPIRPWLVINQWGTVHDYAARGFGIAVCEDTIASGHLRAGRLVRVLPDYGLPAEMGGGLFAVYPNSHILTPKVRVFVDYLVEKAPEAFT